MIFIGIDISKATFTVGFVSEQLLSRYHRFEHCPVFDFPQSRAGYDDFVARLQAFTTLDQYGVLLERTGHYHRPLVQYLQECGIAVWIMHVLTRPARNKSDKRDALELANRLYNQVEKCVQVADSTQLARPHVPESETATTLHGLIRHRYELSHEASKRKNKLICILDELFPEYVQVFHDPNRATALAIREQFATPALIANAPLADLQALRSWRRPSNAALLKLQELARLSIGTKDIGRLRSLKIEQRQLIQELRQLQCHISELDAEIETIITQSREGHILTSIPMMSPLFAATILAYVGSIGNFRSAAALKSYCGWSPTQTQTGTTLDKMSLTRGGNRILKRVFYLLAWNLVKEDTEYRALYERLVPQKCQYDARKGVYVGKNKVMGRIAGQVIGLVYHLLRADYDLLQSQVSDGDGLPEPMCYDRAVHHAHRTGNRLTTPAP